MTARIVSWAAVVVLAVLYAYLAVTAVGNLVGMQESAAGLGLALTGAAWAALITGIVLPAAVLVATVLLSRRVPPGRRVLVVAAGLCFAAAVQLELTHLVGWYPSVFFA